MEVQINQCEIKKIFAEIGQNRVFGDICEKQDLVQKGNSETDKSQNQNILSLDTPYDIFKGYQRDKKITNNKTITNNNSTVDTLYKENKKTDDESSVHSKIMLFFLQLIDPSASLCTSEMKQTKLKKFKEEMSFNLDCGKLFFKKMGFSKKRNLSVLSMKKELESSDSNEIISMETLTYLCRVAGIQLVLLDLKNLERTEINTNKEDVNLFVCDMMKCSFLKIEKGINEVDEIAKTIYKDHMNMDIKNLLKFINDMKINEVRKVCHFIMGDEKIKGCRKKEDMADHLRKKLI